MADQAPPPLRILILDDEATIRATLSLCLEAAAHRVKAVGTVREALEACGSQVFDLLFLDVRLGIENGLDFMPQFLKQSPWMKIIVITAYASIETAVEAMRRGAIDYLPKPFTPEHVETLAGKVAQARAIELRLREMLDARDASAPPILTISENPIVQSALATARTIAESRSAILLQGEGGTGKRTLARTIHEWSPRRSAPYAVCTAQEIEEAALALDLFGGPAGETLRRSRLEFCAGGTLYIDDLAALSPRLQLKLLEFIQSGAFEREETLERVHADVRIIAGTSRPLQALTDAQLFRQDLYYALSAKAIELPPLRHRMEDFAKFAETFLAFYAWQNGKAIRSLSAEAMDYLRGYHWPGNLRELRNVIERAVLLAGQAKSQGVIGIQSLPPNLRAKDAPAQLGDLIPLEAIEELHIRGVLATTKSLESAARILGIDYATLWRRRKKYGL